MDPSRKALHTRHVDRMKDLNDLEIGFMSGIVDAASSITCSQSGKGKKQHLHWMIRVHSSSANLITALRIMTGIGEFLEVQERKTVYWTVGIMDGYFLLLKLRNALQLKHHHAETVFKYREGTLLGKVDQKAFIASVQKHNQEERPVLKNTDDTTFVGYFLGLLEAKATAVLLSSGPAIVVGPFPKSIRDQIITRIGGAHYDDDVIWHGKEEFNSIYKLTKDKLFSFKEPMETLKLFVDGKLNPFDYKQKLEIVRKYEKIDVHKMLPNIDELAKRFVGN
ncbi:MAG: hypothetical protein Q8K86_08260 [Candidatus Nanopelagicaceae bacterium]|nr:hypothetical protein [Candidatus Nanopelagicaceae bacterium]